MCLMVASCNERVGVMYCCAVASDAPNTKPTCFLCSTPISSNQLSMSVKVSNILSVAALDHDVVPPREMLATRACLHREVMLLLPHTGWLVIADTSSLLIPFTSSVLMRDCMSWSCACSFSSNTCTFCRNALTAFDSRSASLSVSKGCAGALLPRPPVSRRALPLQGDREHERHKACAHPWSAGAKCESAAKARHAALLCRHYTHQSCA